MRRDDKYDRFPIAKRGYDPHAVEAFLDVAAADNDRMLNEAAARIAALESELEEAKRQEEAVHLTILAATKAKDDMLEAARYQAGELVANGGKEGDRIVTEARMQAFQLVTGARKEAETIVGEARVEAAAIDRVDEASEIPVDGSAEREAALQQRIDEMQRVIAAMELELSSRPAAAETIPTSAEPTATVDTNAEIADRAEEVSPSDAVAEETPPAPDAEDHGEDIEIVVTDTPPVEAPSNVVRDDTEIKVDDVAVTVETGPVAAKPAASPGSDPSISDERTPEKVRRSFYSRRSARLPRIGAEGGRDAMATMAGLRTNV
jgi:DivIVA domain-containing protein